MYDLEPDRNWTCMHVRMMDRSMHLRMSCITSRRCIYPSQELLQHAQHLSAALPLCCSVSLPLYLAIPLSVYLSASECLYLSTSLLSVATCLPLCLYLFPSLFLSASFVCACLLSLCVCASLLMCLCL